MKQKFEIECELPFVSAVVVAAGNATRMEGVDKQLASIYGIPVVARSLMAFCENVFVSEVVLVCREQEMPELYNLVREYDLTKVSKIVSGGATRQQSVFAGVDAVSEKCRYIAIHDGARPLIRDKVITGCILDAQTRGAVTAGVAVKDTIKVMDKNRAILSTPDRSTLFITQTPQVFEIEVYKQAMIAAIERGLDFTDDCQLVEQMEKTVYFSQGDYENIKITTPEDLIIAEAILQSREERGI